MILFPKWKQRGKNTEKPANIVTKYSLSTRQASRVCTSIAVEGAAELPTSAQSECGKEWLTMG